MPQPCAKARYDCLPGLQHLAHPFAGSLGAQSTYVMRQLFVDDVLCLHRSGCKYQAFCRTCLSAQCGVNRAQPHWLHENDAWIALSPIRCRDKNTLHGRKEAHKYCLQVEGVFELELLFASTRMSSVVLQALLAFWENPAACAELF